MDRQDSDPDLDGRGVGLQEPVVAAVERPGPELLHRRIQALGSSVTWLLDEVSAAFGVAVVRLTEPAATLAIAGRAERQVADG